MRKKLIIAILGVCLALTGCSGVASAESAKDKAKNLDAESVAKAIDDIEADKDGNVTIYLADGRYFDLGNLKGEDGKDGKDGKDGVGISGATINDNGELVLSLTDGSTINNGTVKGSDGKNGSNGTDGANGVGIQSSAVNENGELIITLTDGTTINNGVVQGKDGKDGKDGVDGKDGRDGTDGKDGHDGANGRDGTNGKDGKDGKDGINNTVGPSESSSGSSSEGNSGSSSDSSSGGNSGSSSDSSSGGNSGSSSDSSTGGDSGGSSDSSSGSSSSQDSDTCPVGSKIEMVNLPATYDLGNGAVLHLEEYSETLVEKYTKEELEDEEKRKEILESCGITNWLANMNVYPYYITRTVIKAYIENAEKLSYGGVDLYYSYSEDATTWDGRSSLLFDRKSGEINIDRRSYYNFFERKYNEHHVLYFFAASAE